MKPDRSEEDRTMPDPEPCFCGHRKNVHVLGTSEHGSAVHCLICIAEARDTYDHEFKPALPLIPETRSTAMNRDQMLLAIDELISAAREDSPFHVTSEFDEEEQKTICTVRPRFAPSPRYVGFNLAEADVMVTELTQGVVGWLKAMRASVEHGNFPPAHLT